MTIYHTTLCISLQGTHLLSHHQWLASLCPSLAWRPCRGPFLSDHFPEPSAMLATAVHMRAKVFLRLFTCWVPTLPTWRSSRELEVKDIQTLLVLQEFKLFLFLKKQIFILYLHPSQKMKSSPMAYRISIGKLSLMDWYPETWWCFLTRHALCNMKSVSLGVRESGFLYVMTWGPYWSSPD